MLPAARRYRFVTVFCFFSALAYTQGVVNVQVDASKMLGPAKPVWNYFGYDEPNYTYAANGRKLIHELAALDPEPARIRAHHLLTTGDTLPAFKWGSTNVYTEDAAGKPVYDWTTVDKIIDTYLTAGAKPLVEIGFMPKALSSHPDPYIPVWKPGDTFDQYYVGWSYPPKDYTKWSELIYQWVHHCVEKYGAAQVESWNWEVWNEPNISYWHGTPEEYDKLYDYTAAAVKKALPRAKVGGPGSTGPANAKAGAFLEQFLAHCASGKNNATNQTGAPLDFISFHAKGRPNVVDGHVQMGVSQELKDVSNGFDIIKSTKFHNLPVILTEADPEGCAACSARVYAPNAYRNGTLYPAYTAEALKGIAELANRDGIDLEGVLTWAFEFEGQPYFAGFRTLATNGIDKPVLNVFRMKGLMGGENVAVQSAGAQAFDAVLTNGVRERGTVDASATRSGNSVSVMIWNYRDDDIGGPGSPVQLNLSGLPKGAGRLLVRHYRIDETHSNAYTLWKAMGSPEHPSEEQYMKLEEAGQLQTFDSPHWISAESDDASIAFTLPLQAISLVQFSW